MQPLPREVGTKLRWEKLPGFYKANHKRNITFGITKSIPPEGINGPLEICKWFCRSADFWAKLGSANYTTDEKSRLILLSILEEKSVSWDTWESDHSGAKRKHWFRKTFFWLTIQKLNETYGRWGIPRPRYRRVAWTVGSRRRWSPTWSRPAAWTSAASSSPETVTNRFIQWHGIEG